MTPSPAFLHEISHQVQLARREIEVARAHGDESDALVAAGRLTELEELTRRATDNTLLGSPSWP